MYPLTHATAERCHLLTHPQPLRGLQCYPNIGQATQRRWSQSQIQLSEKHGAVRSRVEERQLFLEAGSIGDEFTRHKESTCCVPALKTAEPQFKVCVIVVVILLIGNYFISITMKIAILFASFAGASAFVSQAPKSVGYVLIYFFGIRNGARRGKWTRGDG